MAALAAAGCGDDGSETARTAGGVTTTAADRATGPATGTVRLYTSVPEPIARQLKEAFSRVAPGVDLDIFRATTGDVEARIATERQAGGVKADVLWVAEPSAYEGYKAQGLLARYSPAEPDKFPPGYIDPDGTYVAARVINMVVAWNTQKMPGGLADWTDLHRPDVRAAFPNPNSGAALAAVKALTDRLDPDYFTKFKAANGFQVTSNGAARDGIVSGEYDAAGVLDYMVRAAKAKGSPVELAYPSSGTVVIPSPVAITSTSQNPTAAKAFVDFLLSREGQQVVVDVGGFYPARTDVAPPKGSPPLSDIKAISVDWKQLVKESDAITTRWAQIFGR